MGDEGLTGKTVCYERIQQKVTENVPKEMISEPGLSIYSVPGTLLGTRNTTLNKIDLKRER